MEITFIQFITLLIEISIFIPIYLAVMVLLMILVTILNTRRGDHLSSVLDSIIGGFMLVYLDLTVYTLIFSIHIKTLSLILLVGYTLSRYDWRQWRRRKQNKMISEEEKNDN